jgi:hypothetical protein
MPMIRPTEVTSSLLVVFSPSVLLRVNVSVAGDAAVLVVMLGEETVAGGRISGLFMLSLFLFCLWTFRLSLDQSFDVVWTR